MNRGYDVCIQVDLAAQGTAPPSEVPKNKLARLGISRPLAPSFASDPVAWLSLSLVFIVTDSSELLDSGVRPLKLITGPRCRPLVEVALAAAVPASPRVSCLSNVKEFKIVLSSSTSVPPPASSSRQRLIAEILGKSRGTLYFCVRLGSAVPDGDQQLALSTLERSSETYRCLSSRPSASQLLVILSKLQMQGDLIFVQ